MASEVRDSKQENNAFRGRQQLHVLLLRLLRFRVFFDPFLQTPTHEIYDLFLRINLIPHWKTLRPPITPNSNMGCNQSKQQVPHHRRRRHRHRRRQNCCCGPNLSSSDAEAGPNSRTHNRHLLTNNSVGSAAVPAASLTLEYSSVTQSGHYPDSPGRLNQDSLSINVNLQSNPNLHLFSVFDGHGQFGAECANFVKETLTLTLNSDPNLAQNPVQAFTSAFEATNTLLHSSSIDDSMSGTTAISVLVYRDSLFVANVGDSRAVLGVWSHERGCVLAEDLSCDQTPYRKDEYERVRGCGARVLTVDQVEGNQDPEVQSWGDEESDEGDPPRLWVQHGMYPGTAFTRSVGDSTAEGIGVVAVPEVKEVKITPECLFFVVASDGVFEFLSGQTVVNMVASFKDPRDACAAIAAESYKIWLEHESRTDDITIIIVHIKGMGNLNAPTTDEASQIISRASRVVSEKARSERYLFQGSDTCPDFSIERSLACVAPSPEHNILQNVTNPG